MKQEDYFSKNIKSLNIQRKKYQSILENKTQELISPLCYGKILDIGFGGRINYNTENITELHLLDIFKPEINITDKKIKIYEGDFLEVSFEDNYFDKILLIYTIHHLAKSNLNYSLNYLMNLLKKCNKILKSDGEIIILEGMIGEKYFFYESMFYKFLLEIYKFLRKPPVLLYSDKKLKEIIINSNLNIISKEIIKMPELKITPFNYNIFIPKKYLDLNVFFIKIKKYG